MKKITKARTIFMGTSGFASIILRDIINAGCNIVSVYTQPDKKIGRDQEFTPSKVKITAEEFRIPVFEPSELDENTRSEIASQKPDLIILVAYGKIIPGNILGIPSIGIINIHGSLLPKYRGPSPIQNALLEGVKETGATIMLMDEGIDTGDIISQEIIPISENETYPELSEKMAAISSQLLLKTLPLWISGDIKPQPQDSLSATNCQLIEKSDGKIFWDDDAKNIYNKYRAFFSWPGVFAFWENDGTLKRIKFNKISYEESEGEKNHHIGEVFRSEKGMAIQAAKGLIYPEIIQMEGKKEIAIDEFANGYPNFIGSILK